MKQEKIKLDKELVKADKELVKANQIIKNLNNTKKSNNNNTVYNQNEINNLYSLIQEKEDEITSLKEKLNKNSNTSKYVPFNDIIVIHFISSDQRINCGVKCLKTDTFAEVEEQLYKIYSQYRDTNNFFISNGKQVLRFKKIYENNIKDKDKVELIQYTTTHF